MNYNTAILDITLQAVAVYHTTTHLLDVKVNVEGSGGEWCHDQAVLLLKQSQLLV